MGLFKKMAERAAANAPDYLAEIAALQPGDTVRAIAHTALLAFEADKSVRRQGVIGVAINSVSQAVRESKHLSGAPGSAAMSIPRDVNGQITVAISEQQLSMWSFGVRMNEIPPTCLAAFPIGTVTSIAPTGDSSNYGAFMRFTFTDESYIDLAVPEYEVNAPFLEAAAAVGR